MGRGRGSDDPSTDRCHRQDGGHHDLRHRPPHPQGRCPRGGRAGADPRARGHRRHHRDRLRHHTTGRRRSRHPVVRELVWALLVLPPGPVQPLPRSRGTRRDRMDLRLHDRRDAGRVRPRSVRGELRLQGPRRHDRRRGDPAVRHPAHRLRDRRAVRACPTGRCRGRHRLGPSRTLGGHDRSPVWTRQDHRRRPRRRPLEAGRRVRRHGHRQLRRVGLEGSGPGLHGRPRGRRRHAP